MSSIGGAGAMMSGTPIGGASLSGGMGTAGRGGMSVARPASRTPLVPFGYEGGIGSAGMSGLPMTRQAGMRSPSPATGPGFGSPFRVPPSPGGGASMTMP